jgi:hypothetical protein
VFALEGALGSFPDTPFGRPPPLDWISLAF